MFFDKIKEKAIKDYFATRCNLGFGLSTTSGTTVTQENVMQLTAVYACIRILAESIASLPLQVYKTNDSGGYIKDTKHSLYKLLYAEPNKEMTSFNFRETLMYHLLLYGNAYAQIIRNYKGDIVALYPLLPDKMDLRRNDKNEIVYCYIRETDNNIEEHILSKDDVLHIAGLGYDGVRGHSPIEMAKNALGMAISTEEYGASYFKNTSIPSGILEHPGTIKDATNIRESWQQAFGGSKKAGQVVVLEEGMQYKPLKINPQEAQFLETRKFQIDEIARIFRIPPHMIGDLEKSSFSNIEQQSIEFVKYTLTPWITRWEQQINKQLFKENEKIDHFVKFNVDALLRGEYQSRMNGYAIGRQNGWLSANDIRRLENQPPISADDGGDDYLINGNMIKIKDAGIYAKKGGEQDA